MRQRHALYTLARYLAAAYVILILYASLHPFSDWRDSGVGVLDFLHAAWPRYYTGFDLLFNVMAYLPLGLLLMPALQPAFKPGWAFVATVLAGAGLSLSMEVLQNYLPSRVPSNVDLGCNIAGAFLGAAGGARWGAVFRDGGRLYRWRRRRILGGAVGDAGLVLLGLWLLCQLNPEILLFGTGDVRRLLGLPAPFDYSPERFILVELAVAGCGVLAAGLLGWLTMRERSGWLLLGVLLLALLIKTFVSMLLSAGQFVHWATPGNMAGFAAGLAVLGVAMQLPAWAQHILAALALLAGTLLVNLAPENPYLNLTVSAWQSGHFLNFNGLTRLTSSLWPFFALAYLSALGSAEAGRR